MLEVVVVGGGIAGASVALDLAEGGAAVSLVDAERPGAAATGASAGMLAPQYESDAATPLFRLLVQARDYFTGWAARLEAMAGRDTAVRRDGMLVANLTEEEHAGAEANAAWQRAGGFAAELLDVGDALRLQPGLGGDPVSYLWLPDEGQVDSQALAHALAEALDASPVRVIAGRRVTAVLPGGTGVRGVRLADGRTIDADAVVVAAGAWSGALDGLPRPVPVRPVRGHLLRYPPPRPGLGLLLAAHAGRYLVPRADGTVLAGSTMDEVGFDRSLSEESIALVRSAAGALLPALAGVEPLERWADLRPISDDGLPILGPDPDLAGLFYATGYGRNGILLGPLAGRIVADLVLRGESEATWHGFGAARLG